MRRGVFSWVGACLMAFMPAGCDLSDFLAGVLPANLRLLDSSVVEP